MSQRSSLSIWLMTLLVAVVLGIWPGIVMGLGHDLWFAALFGWPGFLLGIYQLATGNISLLASLGWYLTFGYPVAMLGYSVCASWLIRRSGKRRAGLLLVGVSACVSTLVAWMTAILTRAVPIGFEPGALAVPGLILLNLVISAVLGWLIAVWRVRHTGNAERQG